MDTLSQPSPHVDLETTISNLRAIVIDPNCQSMNKSTVKGFLGELLVMQKLVQEGASVKHLGNQKGYDIQITSPTEIRIDVKTSAANLCDSIHTTWGWALHSMSKKRPISCTHFVCVALNKDLRPDSYFIIPSASVLKFPPLAGQFKSVLNFFAAHHPKNPFETSNRWHSIHEQCQDLLDAGLTRRIDANGDLLSNLIS